jgi:WD40 repeat protein
MIARAKLVSAQVEKENLVDTWIDEGLSFVDKSYWKDVVSQARLLYHYGRGTDRLDCRAWGDFFDAVRLKDYGLASRADSLLKTAYQKFSEAGSNEGMQWISSVRKAVLDSTGIQMNIQKIHNLQYDIVPSPNERYFSTAGRDGTIKFWDIGLAKQIKSIEAHNNEINSITYNPGGRYLASVSDDSTIKIWNTFSYGQMNTIKTSVPQRWVRFSPDGKILVTSGYDSTLNFWEPFEGKLIKSFRSPGGSFRRFSFIPGMPTTMYMVSTDSSLYSFDMESDKFKMLFKSKTALWTMQVSRNGKYLAYYSGDSSMYIYSLEGGRFIFSEKTFVWSFVDSRYYSTGDFSPDEKYYVYMRHDSNTVVIDLDQRLSVPFHGYLTGQYIFNNSGKYYLSQYVGAPSIVDFSEFDFNKAYDLFYGKAPQNERNESYRSLKEKEFKTSYGPVLDMRFPKGSRTLEYSSYGTFGFDPFSGKASMIHQDPPWLRFYNEYPATTDLVFHRNSGINDSLFVFDNLGKTRKAALYLGDGEKINTAACFIDNTKCIIGGDKGTIACFSLQANQIEYIIKGSNTFNIPVIGLQWIPGTNQLVMLRREAKPFLLDATTGNILDSLPVPAGGIAMNHEKFWITDTKGRLFSGNISNLKMWDTLAFRSKSNFFDLIRMSPSGKYLMMLDAPFCHVLNTATGEILHTLQPELKNIQCMAISPDDSLLLIGTLNGEISIHKLQSGIQVAKLILPSPSDPVITDTAGYYLASKTALQNVIFSKGYRTYNYDQFDLELNQPHKVLASIGMADQATLSAYEKAYEKRLKKSGVINFRNVKASTPSIIILNRASIKPSTNRDYYTIKTECFDVKNKLNELRVSVNDVPMKDSLLKFAHLDTGSMIINVAIPLTPGNNRVKLYCTNKAGVSSYKEVIEIYSTSSSKKQKTWFIGLGVANYADTTNNLIYSVKDIRDLAKRFKEIYPEIIIDTLLNKQVTLKNLELLKKRLEKVTVSDRVIMAVTGHGVLSENLDFYYATYDMDFKNPESKGLPYDQLEQILNETAARQKLLLIDACHSGLVDKENVVSAKSVLIEQDSTSGEINIKETRGFKPKVTQKVDEANTFNLMQNMFADFSNDNGIVVISAAGGLEYAFESPRWNNGVFT